MKNIDFKTTITSIEAFADRNNANYKRGHINHINSTRLSVMIAMAKIYGGQLRRRCRKERSGRPTKAQVEFWSILPPLETNNIELSKKVKCSDRTVRRHVKALLEQGEFIQSKEYHGPVNDYSVFLNVDILKVLDSYALHDYRREEEIKKEAESKILDPVLKAQSAVEYIKAKHEAIVARQKAEQELNDLKKLKRKGLSEKITTDNLSTSSKAFLTEITLNTNNTEKRSEENPADSDSPSASRFDLKNDLPASDQSGNLEQETHPKQSEPSGNAGTYSAAPGRSFQQNQSAGDKIARQLGVNRTPEANQGTNSTMKEDLTSKPFRGGALLALAQQKSQTLWKQMCKLLYDQTPLDDHEVETAKDILLWYYATAQNAEQLEKFHEQFTDRVAMVAKWKNAKDYRFIIRPSLYLDPRNATGFVKTATWLKKRENDRTNKKMMIQTKRLVMSYNNEPTVEMYEACLQVLDKHMPEYYINRFKWYVENKISNEQINL